MDVVIYDVLGDVVCGGFSVPLREKYADEVIIVTSGEYMSLYAANNIVKGIKKLKGNLSGIICNCRNVDHEKEIVSEFASKIGTRIIGTINRSNLIQESELDAKTVVEKYPESKEANEYDVLATNIMENKVFTTPEPMDDEDFEKFFKSFLESVTQTVIGLLTSIIIQLFLYPAMGIPVTFFQNIIITLVFFIVSILRGYVIRRYFTKKSKL